MNQHRFFNLLRAALLVLLMTAAASMASAAEKSYTIAAPDGVALAVQEAGDPHGPAIVFIHGLLGSRLSWEKQVSSPELQRFHLITWDLRGHGLSGKPAEAEAYRDGNRFADDLAAVLKATGAERPVLVGWSLGGVVISNYLAAYGDDRLGGVMYVDGVVELNPVLITSHPEVYAGMASEDLKTHLDAVRTFIGLCFAIRPDTETLERLLANAAMASWTMTRTVPAMTVNAAKGLPKARVPVMMLYGNRDELVNVAPTLARARQLNAHIQTKIYEKSGHAPFLEEAPRFNHDLAIFVKSVADGSKQ